MVDNNVGSASIFFYDLIIAQKFIKSIFILIC